MSARALRLAVFAIWLVFSIVLVVTNRGAIAHFHLHDADDALRLVEVRDWMAGQSWFDVSQYRINPPGGVPMHWSRLVDIPLAGAIALFGLAATPVEAERLALTVVPLLTLLALFASVAALTLRVSGERLVAAIAAIMLAGSFGVLGQFSPMRIDHHGWQIVLAVLAAWFIVGATRGQERRALWAGLVIAASLIIALEGLPIAVGMAGVAALRFLRDPDGRAGLEAYMLGLVGGCALLLIVTLGWPRSAVPWCDAMSPAYVLPMTATLIMLLAVPRLLGDATLGRRLLALALAGAAGAAVFALHSHQCLAGPFAALDPLVYRLWYQSVGEGMPVWTQERDVAILIPIQGIIGLIGTALAVRFASSPQREGWAALLMLQIVSFAVSLMVMRAFGVAHALALPGAAWLFLTALRRALRLTSSAARILLGFSCFFLTPIGLVSVATMMFVPSAEEEKPGDGKDARTDCVGRDVLHGLAALPPSVLFTPMDIGSHIVAFTPHSVIATGHHRNVSGMRKVVTAFIAAPEDARRIIATTPASYLVICPDDNEVKKLASVDKRSLIAGLAKGRAPDWLQPVPLHGDKALRVYRITPAAAPVQPGAKRIATPFMQ